MEQREEFGGKTVVITGGASGLGLLAGKNFARLGANVALLDVAKEELVKRRQELVDELEKERDPYAAFPRGTFEKQRVSVFPVDIRQYAQIMETCAQIMQRYGRIDLLINCAGGAASRIWNCSAEFKDTPIEVYDWGIDVNLKGTFYMCHSVMKYMAEQNAGVILNIGSISGEEGSPDSPDYAMCKSGIMYGLTRSLALYGAQYHIRVCCISPGPVLTRPGMAGMKTLLGRAAQPQEIVDMMLYLASEKAAFITGTNYLIDGGRLFMREKN